MSDLSSDRTTLLQILALTTEALALADQGGYFQLSARLADTQSTAEALIARMGSNDS